MKKDNWLDTALNGSWSSLPAIRMEVREIMMECDLNSGERSRRCLSRETSSILTRRSAGSIYKYLPLIRKPLNASINITSTLMVGKKAKTYFAYGDVKSLREILFYGPE